MNIPFEIIDFHTHPFMTPNENICSHTEFCGMSPEQTERDMREMGVTHICGSVLQVQRNPENIWGALTDCNAIALKLAELYKGFYIPGFHVHPDFVRESCDTIEKMHAAGVNLIGELVPYWHRWSDYSCAGMDEILDLAEQYEMLVSFHSIGEDEMDKMVEKHPRVHFVAAHPGEYGAFCRHMERMKKSENYYLDVSGYGLFRHGMLRHALDLFGSDRFIFGSDYPTCNPAMYIGGVLLDRLISDNEKEKIFYSNAKRLLAESGMELK